MRTPQSPPLPTTTRGEEGTELRKRELEKASEPSRPAAAAGARPLAAPFVRSPLGERIPHARAGALRCVRDGAS